MVFFSFLEMNGGVPLNIDLKQFHYLLRSMKQQLEEDIWNLPSNFQSISVSVDLFRKMSLFFFLTKQTPRDNIL